MTRLQDDFTNTSMVNGQTAVIPDDKPRTGGFSDLADEIEKLMIDTTNAWLAEKTSQKIAFCKTLWLFTNK